MFFYKRHIIKRGWLNFDHYLSHKTREYGVAYGEPDDKLFNVIARNGFSDEAISNPLIYTIASLGSGSEILFSICHRLLEY